MKEIYRSERSEAMADIYKDVMYDYCAILIISILIITTILRRMVKGKVNRSFMEVLVVAWLAVLFDVWARYLDNLGVQQMVTKYAVHMGYLVLSSLAMPFYIAYVVSMTDTWHLFKAKRFLTFLSLLPVFAITAMIVVSPATKWIFYINAECEYGNICNLWADLSGYIPENVPAKISCSFGNRICSGDCKFRHTVLLSYSSR